MAKKSWRVELEDSVHTVELEHGYWSGKRTISIDGERMNLPQKEASSFFDFGSHHTIHIGQVSAIIHIKTNGLTFNYDLSIEGRSVETGRTVTVTTAPAPRWAWAFVAACGLIPVLSLGGAIPLMIGMGGSTGCYAIALNPSRYRSVRLLLCTGITLLCCVLFIGLIAFVAGATSY